MDAVSQRVEAARRRRRMSGRTLAAGCGRSWHWLNRRIDGRVEWRTKDLAAVAATLRVRTEWLAGVE